MEVQRSKPRILLQWHILSLFLCFGIHTGASEKVGKHDLTIMMQLKKMYGSKVKEMDSWRADRDCDDWENVDCSGDRISKVDLQGKNLGGKFPYIATKLINLTQWYSDGNNFTGPFPAGFANCKNMEALRLSGNLLSGPLPASFGGLKRLYKFFVKENHFLSGPIPRTWGQLNLQEAYFDSNRFSGPLPTVICNWSILRALRIGNNRWTGVIPDCITKLTDLQNLYMDNIQLLSGRIPPNIGALTNLKIIHLNGGKVTGPIPESIGNLKQLEILFLSGNAIQGPLPQRMGELDSLKSWTMEFNQIGGMIPTTIGNMKSVERILLNSNRLHGPIPASMGNLKTLTMLLLQGNKLSGEVPSRIPRKLDKLDQFNVADNWLSGKVPSNWASKNIRQVNLRSNYFYGKPDMYYDNGRLLCPDMKINSWIISSTGFNCFGYGVKSKCGEEYDELQRNPALCTKFCGANGPKGPCNGKGRCVWAFPKWGFATCRCNPGTKKVNRGLSCK